MRTEIDNWKHVVVFVEGACVNGSPGCLLIRKPIIAWMGRFSINTPLRSGRKNYQRPYQSRVRAFYWPLTRHFSVNRPQEWRRITSFIQPAFDKSEGIKPPGIDSLEPYVHYPSN